MATYEQHGDVFVLSDSVEIHAPIDRCFSLTCNIALVREELGMKPVSGRTDGFVDESDIVRWEGWQLGLKHFHVSHISGFRRPVFMQDSMLDGRFKTFQHDHHLSELANGMTLLKDEIRFSLHFGALGRIVARMIMVPHIRGLLRSRFARIKRIAEGEAWREYLPEESGITQSAEVLG